MKIKQTALYLSLSMITTMTPALADESNQWFSRGHFGLTQLSNQSAQANGLGFNVNALDAKISAGFASGLSVGYQINPKWAAELGWDGMGI